MTREQIINETRKWIGARFGHQGRTMNAMDCGGLMLVVGRALCVTEFEELGYASYPTQGRFDEILAQELERLDFESTYPHKFNGTELQPADLISFDYMNGEGTRHVAMVTKWDGRCYWIIEATAKYGVTEHPFKYPFTKDTKIQGWRVRGLD